LQAFHDEAVRRERHARADRMEEIAIMFGRLEAVKQTLEDLRKD
jgi:hypothetical protein